MALVLWTNLLCAEKASTAALSWKCMKRTTQMSLICCSPPGSRRSARAPAIQFRWSEGHGRETELSPTSIYRTVGWFTTHYPLHVHLAKAWDPGNLLKQVKEQIDGYPARGLIWCSPLPALEHALASQDTPPVLFNYMGQLNARPPRRFKSGPAVTGRLQHQEQADTCPR
jgi:hypothetical protein